MEVTMAEQPAELLVTLSLDEGDEEELDELTRQLKSEIEELSVNSVENVLKGGAPEGTKAIEWIIIGKLAVDLAPIVIPPLFALIKSWIERKPSTPVKVKITVGKKTAQIEYDPTKTSAKELENLVKTLGKTAKK
jgi:hypothetical protein